MTQELLIEIGCEDLPARYVLSLAEALAAGMTTGLQAAGVDHGEVRPYATPRRIAVCIAAVAERQPDQVVERSGPSLSIAFKDGRPTPAALGFARSCGVELKALKHENGQLVLRRKRTGQPTARLIPALFEVALKQMDTLVPKRMRWGDGAETFVRPVQWLVALFGDKLIPIRRFGLKAGRKTRGHRFHAPQVITLQSPLDYESALKQAKVWADFASRRDVIRRGVELKAQELGGIARITEELLDEVTALIEWPVVIAGKIESRFLQLPPEVIIATVETNQRYFAVFDEAGKLLPAFITIANIESKDPAQVIAGNERVVRPRLSDALFFWNQDLSVWKKDANSGYLELGNLLLSTPWGVQARATTYLKGLGSYDQRLSRVQVISSFICEKLRRSDQNAQIAAVYAKLDLFSKMVFEFPELQGVMGSYYARSCGIPEDICLAIKEQYLPNSATSDIPRSFDGRVLALADRLDTLAGVFAMGQRPTASKDPFALRRAALGVLRIIREGKMKVRWFDLVLDAVAQQPVAEDAKAKARSWLREFIFERYRNLCVGSRLCDDAPEITLEQFKAVESLKHELLDQALATGDNSQAEVAEQARIDDIEDFELRLAAVQALASLPEARSLTTANKRVRHILRHAEEDCEPVNPGLLTDSAEHELFAKLEEIERLNADDIDYTQQLINLASLSLVIDSFFERVLVNAEDAALRRNRLALLRSFDRACRQVADLSQLPG